MDHKCSKNNHGSGRPSCMRMERFTLIIMPYFIQLMLLKTNFTLKKQYYSL